MNQITVSHYSELPQNLKEFLKITQFAFMFSHFSLYLRSFFALYKRLDLFFQYFDNSSKKRLWVNGDQLAECSPKNCSILPTHAISDKPKG